MKILKLREIAEGRVGSNLPSDWETRLDYPISIPSSDYSHIVNPEKLQKYKEEGSRTGRYMELAEDEVFVVQMGDVKRDFLNVRSMKRIKLPCLPKRVATIEPGDIIYRSRGATISENQRLSDELYDIGYKLLGTATHKSRRFSPVLEKIISQAFDTDITAVVAPTDLGPAVLASPLYLIQIKDREVVLPDYLCWHINQASAQYFLHRIAAGTNLKTVSIQQLLDLPVSLPSLAQQEKMLELYYLWIQERSLSEQMIRMKDEYWRVNLLEASKISNRSKSSPTL